MTSLYTLGIIIYTGLIRLTAIWSVKAREWINGRITQRDEIRSLHVTDAPIWFHCSSLGEFEQARPVIESLRQKTNQKILLTFFSPSGYLPRQNYHEADWIYYLPADTKRNARWWLDTFQPKLLILAKYDFWFNMIQACHDREIPVVLISALFRPNQYFFSFLGKSFRFKLQRFHKIFVQNVDSKHLLQRHGFKNVDIAGDSRIDRVLKIASKTDPMEIISTFCKDKKTILFGSSWQQEETILFDWLKNQDYAPFKVILVPHDVSDKNISALKRRIPIPYSTWTDGHVDHNHTLLLIDTTGLLNKLYYFAWMAIIGGGFRKSIHNILEPMAFKVPIGMGPNYHRFPEAVQMVEQKGAFVIRNASDFSSIVNRLKDPDVYGHAQDAISDFLSRNKGATKRIINYLEESALI